MVGTGEVEEGKYCRQSVGAIKGALSALRGQFLAESTFRVMPVYCITFYVAYWWRWLWVVVNSEMRRKSLREQPAILLLFAWEWILSK